MRDASKHGSGARQWVAVIGGCGGWALSRSCCCHHRSLLHPHCNCCCQNRSLLHLHCSCGWDGAGDAASQEGITAGSAAGSTGAPGAAPAEQIAAATGPPLPLRFSLSTKGPGRVLVYTSAAPIAVEVAGGGVRFDYHEATGALSFDAPPGIAGRTDWVLQF